MSYPSLTEGTLGRLTWLAQGLSTLSEARSPLAQAAGLIAGTGHTGDSYVAELSALNTLMGAQYERLANVTCECARQLGWQVAVYEIVPLARDSGNDPVVWITGNSMMPPLRDFWHSNGVWNMGAEIWQAYVEGVERGLEEQRVYMGCPDYDNALYVVDLARFESTEQDDAEFLADEWRPLSND